jgi:hypothetical protein
VEADNLIYDFRNPQDVRTALLHRYSALKTERSSWYTHWRDLTRYLLPRSGRFFVTDRNRSDRSFYNAIYDNTGTRALRTLGAGMMSGISSQARPWFRLSTHDPDLAEFWPVRVWLDDVAERMYGEFERGNTYRVLHSMYEQLGVYGTAVSMVLPDARYTLHHYPIACGEYCLQQDYQGRIIAMYREFEKTVGEVVKEFAIRRPDGTRDLSNLSVAVRTAWDQRQLENPVQILHVIEPRADQDRNLDSPFAKDMPWRSVFIELTSNDENKLLRDSGFNRFPILAPRWVVDGGDVYGTSPGMEALGDIRQLQQQQLRKGQAIDYQVKPPLQVPSSLKNRDVEGYPGGISYYEPGMTLPFDQITPNGGIRSAFEVTLDLSHLLVDMQDCRQRINAAMYVDLFLMLANISDTTMRTAAEIAVRHEEKLTMLGPVISRLHNEALQPLIDMMFDEMWNQGKLPPPPDELLGQDLTVEFVSILAQAQQQIGSTNMDRFMGNVMAVSQVRPDVLDKINFDKWVDRYSRRLGVDAELIQPDERVLAVRQARAAAQAAQEQVQLGNTQSQTAKNLAQSPISGANALTALAGQEVKA